MDKQLSREHKRNGELNDLKKTIENSLRNKQSAIRVYGLPLHTAHCTQRCRCLTRSDPF
jgi:hypothetical protein